YGLIARMAWLGAHHVNVGAYSPQPNTALYHELVREGRIPPEPELDDTFFADLFGYLDLTEIRSWNARIGDRELTAMVIAAYALFFSVSFLRRPSRLWALFRDLFRAESQGKLGKYARSVWSTSKQLRAPTK
ncbi:MAG: hypothetical protein KA205_08330, partial [Acidobacteria bacterium]|nr:hypothetical protein [Acidobacteriota bacterium]